MGTRPGNSFYAKTPLWRRVLRLLAMAILVPLLFVLFAFLNGWFFDADPDAENVVVFVGLYAAISAVVFLITVVMFEFWWRRHPPAWMVTDDDDRSVQEPDYRG